MFFCDHCDEYTKPVRKNGREINECSECGSEYKREDASYFY